MTLNPTECFVFSFVVTVSSHKNTNTTNPAWKSHKRHKCSLKWFRMCFEHSPNRQEKPLRLQANHIIAVRRAGLMIGITLPLAPLIPVESKLWKVALELLARFHIGKHVKKLKKEELSFTGDYFGISCNATELETFLLVSREAVMLKSVNDAAAGSSKVKLRSRTSHDFQSNLFVVEFIRRSGHDLSMKIYW